MKTKTHRSMYIQIADQIRKAIVSQTYSNGSAIPSERDLCLQYMVSRQTIRNALAQLTEEGWLVSFSGKGSYVQSPPQSKTPASKVFLPKSRKTIGLIYSSNLLLNDPFNLESLIGMKSVLSQNGYSLVLSASTKRGESNAIPCYEDWIHHRMMDGYLVWSAMEAQSVLAGSGHPVVSIGYVKPGIEIPSVALDFRYIYQCLMRHLRDKGHRDFQIVLHQNNTVWDQACFQGVMEGMNLKNKKDASKYIVQFDDRADELVSIFKSVCHRKNRPTVVVLPDGKHLDSIWPLLKSLNIQVPQDLEIVAVQANPRTCREIHRLTYFQYDRRQLFSRATQKLLQLIHGQQIESLCEWITDGIIVDAQS